METIENIYFNMPAAIDNIVAIELFPPSGDEEEDSENFNWRKTNMALLYYPGHVQITDYQTGKNLIRAIRQWIELGSYYEGLI